MPRVKPFGSPDAKMAAIAKRAGQRVLMNKEETRRKINALQQACGYESRERFAAALNMEERRMTYIIDRPEACRLVEAVTIEALARQYDYHVFDIGVTIPE